MPAVGVAVDDLGDQAGSFLMPFEMRRGQAKIHASDATLFEVVARSADPRSRLCAAAMAAQTAPTCLLGLVF